MSSMTTQIKINYKEYPECMFAMIAAFLPDDEGEEVRRVAGKVFFRSEDECGNTHRNGLLHSFDDQPAISDFFKKSWFKDGKLHRDGDKQACISRHYHSWYKNGKRHREGDKPAFIAEDNSQEWWVNGVRHREGDKPAIESSNIMEWWKNGMRHREIADGPAVINNMLRLQEWWVNGEYLFSERQ